MGRQSLKLDANPKIIEWVIKDAGWELKEFLEKTDISKKTYDKWINKKDGPTLRQLELISQKTKRPLAIFFLNEIPEQKPKPKDFRLNPDQIGKFDKKTILAIRKARKLQYILKDFGENVLGKKIEELDISLDSSPEKVALELREYFGISEEKQRKSKDVYTFLRFLREKLEEEKIFNFQISMPLEDARGFVLSDDLPRVIVINSKDIPEARVFTLIHEFGHILLGDTGVSIPALGIGRSSKNERWCNEFASCFLLPPKMAKRIFEENDKDLIEYKTLNKLSRKYKVSKSMLLYSMVKLKFIAPENYQEILDKYSKKDYTKVSEGGGGETMEKRCIRELGTGFISLVADQIDKKNITYSDALDYLDIKSRGYDKLMKKI